MSVNTQELETIVRMVIDRLRDSGAGVAGTIEAASVPLKTVDSPASLNSSVDGTTRGTFVLTDCLITLETLGDNLSGITSVQVPRGSVVTPAAIDHLRHKGIKLVRQVNSPNANRSNTAPGISQSGLSPELYLIAGDDKYHVVRSVNKQQNVESILAGQDETATAMKLAKQGSQIQSMKAVWCAARPYAAQVACAKQPGLSFVSLLQATDLPRAVEQASPQVIILDDSRWSGFQVAKLFQAWIHVLSRGGSR